MRLLELGDKLRARGLTVREVAGWQGRGNDFPSRPDIALRHWTGGPLTGLAPSLAVCTHGRGGFPPLPGPLCQVLQSREVDHNGLDVVHLVASGKANHAGEGEWNGVTGNYASVGLEIEWSGPGEQFVGIRRRQETSELVMRALLDCCLGTNPHDACEHREYARPRGRKIDTNLSGGHLRDRMADLATDEGELTMADITELRKQLDRIENAVVVDISLGDQVEPGVTNLLELAARTDRNVTVLGDELFHAEAIDRVENMPDAGQRKVNFWGLMAGGKRLAATEDEVAEIKDEVTEIKEMVGAILAKLGINDAA